MKITITGVPPYDGTYPFDYDRLTNRDNHDIKRISGNLPLEIDKAAERGDTDLLVAFAVIALRKNGHVRINEDAIWDAELAAITLDLDDDEADAVPPPSETETPTKPSGSASSSVSALRPANPPPSTGTPSSDTPESASGISAS
jgi:hypothetical protein